MFLDAVAILKEDNKVSSFQFVIIGDGELKQELKSYSIELGIQDSIAFIGWQKNMPNIYHWLDAITITSLNEGTPVTLIEAMASGKPVIATDVGGVRDLLGSNGVRHSEGFELGPNGILIPSGRSDVLAKAFLYITENQKEAQKMSERARNFVLTRYSLNRLVNDMESLYFELMNS